MKRRDFFKYSIGGILGGLRALLWPKVVSNPIVIDDGDWHYVTYILNAENECTINFWIRDKRITSLRYFAYIDGIKVT